MIVYQRGANGMYGIMIPSMADALTEAQQTIDRLRSAGDKMAESLDRQADMLESDGADMRGQRELTKQWQDAKGKVR